MINLKYCWTKHYNENRQIPMHSHDFYELVFYEKGEGSTIVGGVEYKFKNKSYIIIEPNIQHSENHIDASVVYVIGFELVNEPEKTTYFCDRENLDIGFFLNHIFQEQRRKEPYYDKLIEGDIRQILNLIEREKTPNKKTLNNIVISEALEYINSYYATDINIEELAIHSGYCSDRFRIIFKQTVGKNPKEYLSSVRLAEAKRLLIETKETVDSIAEKVGFQYSSRFSAFFKQKTGYYPVEYRKKNL